MFQFMLIVKRSLLLLLLLLLLFAGCLLLNKSRVVDVSNRLNLGEVLQPTPNAAIKEIAPRRAGDTTSRTTAIDCHIQARFAYSVLIGLNQTQSLSKGNIRISKIDSPIDDIGKEAEKN